ncbi:MAG: hypothetical protein A2X94_11355 [Bdellovibrionales bacterium GWB1_55_8]|nr:MAG: hypothetical protein A2X94_11355 [Bdellovibrionales bacterium GWB1_55_8]
MSFASRLPRCHLIAFTLLSGFLVAADCRAETKNIMKDATSVEVRVSSRPERIITLVPSLGELTADLLGEELPRLIAVADQTDYPPALAKLAKVGAYHRFNIEAVAGLKPDLVLASTDGNAKDQVLRLRELGVPVVVVETGDFNQIAQSMRLVARALGRPQRGEEMAAQFMRGVESIRARARSRKGTPPKVLLQVGSNPLVVAGPKSFLHEALITVGAENIYADSSSRYPRPSLEDAVHRRPDVILVVSMGPSPVPARNSVESWKAFPEIPAVKNGRLHLLLGDSLVRPTLRLLEGLSLLEKGISR